MQNGVRAWTQTHVESHRPGSSTLSIMNLSALAYPVRSFLPSAVGYSVTLLIIIALTITALRPIMTLFPVVIPTKARQKLRHHPSVSPYRHLPEAP